jgi:hypothetical protein
LRKQERSADHQRDRRPPSKVARSSSHPCGAPGAGADWRLLIQRWNSRWTRVSNRHMTHVRWMLAASLTVGVCGGVTSAQVPAPLRLALACSQGPEVTFRLTLENETAVPTAVVWGSPRKRQDLLATDSQPDGPAQGCAGRTSRVCQPIRARRRDG